MAFYTYTAINSKGRYVKGKSSAANPTSLASSLKSTGLDLASYKLIKNTGLSKIINGLSVGKITPKELFSIFVYLEQLERSGVPIADAIWDLKESADSAVVRNLMQEIHEAIKSGSMLSESFAKRPDIFDEIYVGLIVSGEKTGNLAGAFLGIIEHLKWSIDIKRKVRKATIGPIFGIVLMGAVVGVMSVMVIPKITQFLTSQNIDLPFATRALVAFSGFMVDYWWLLLLSIPVTMFGLKIARRNKDNAIKIDHYKFKVPVIGPILNKIDCARFCHFFAMSFKSGIGVLECIDSASKAVNNQAMRYSLMQVKKKISDGSSLARSIRENIYFPPIVARMFKVGEDSGNMEDALRNVRFFYDREINDSIDRLISVIQPTLTFVMGGLLLWTTVAVFGPVYGSFSQIKQ